MARYNKKRARELKHDAFRDTTMGLFDRLGNLLEGKGQLILYSLVALIALGILFGTWTWWSGRKSDEARRALGRAIEIADAPVTPSPSPGSTALSFPSERERAQRAIDEFQKVAAKYKDYREKANYFIATNLLLLDRNKGIDQLKALTASSDKEIATLSKFALAQAREAGGEYDEAARLYSELAQQNSLLLPAETANLRLASVYEKQGKKKEAADLLYAIVDASRKAKDAEGKPATKSSAAREAAQKLERLDSARFAQLPPEPVTTDLPL